MNQVSTPRAEDEAALKYLSQPDGLAWPRRTLWIAGITVVALAALWAVRGWMNEASPIRWQMAKVDRADIRVVVSATGQLEPVSVVVIGAEISGRVAAVEVDYNDRVEAGQVLARIDTETLETQLEQSSASLAAAVAAVAEAKASLAEATKTIQRTQELARAGAVSSSRLETAEAANARAVAALRSARAQHRLAEAKVRSVRTDIDKALLTSPISGVVLTRNVEPGNTVVAALQSPTLFEIAEDLRQMRLYADIDEADVGRVQKGQLASFVVDAWPADRFRAEVLKVRLAPDVSSNVVTYKAVLSVDNRDQRLRPGMTATANIVAQTEIGALRVPNSALRFTPPESSQAGRRRRFFGPPRPSKPKASTAKDQVWVLKNGAPVPIDVAAGVSDGRHTQIVDGKLAEGAKIIVGIEEAP